MRITLTDIAREAGVSTATVDRVLNNRSGVRNRTHHRVMAAAERLGYIEQAPVRSHHPADPAEAVQLDFVLPGGTNSFIANLNHQISQMAALRDDVTLRIHMVDGFNPDVLARTLEAIRPTTLGVALVGLDHPTVREAIRALAAADIPVVTLISDIRHVPRIGYIGIDNRAAGRLAGYLLGRFLKRGTGKVALFAGSLSYRGHEEREMGFRNILQEEYPDLAIVELREVRDDIDRAYTEAKALLGRHPDLAGIYNIGGGNRGIARALEEAGRAESTIFIGHELTEHTRRFLVAGAMDAVIDQNPRVEAREAIDRLARAARGEALPDTPSIRVQAIFRENMPD
ncbi:LacI family DNA-binding transcriptional regulator [Kaistia dalseonensis]|uniref:LacI family transcriptional regulator n=1 Tax=Kaistia dalseonensis TaxID=410840 RepID=A0ABU0HDM3_9HYPH|nr:LacI family DNA-binding transcriptional regulator [Kaistia dalseonensis]MCX5497779.1 LacI family DNA-binding transcriptional regulator [Kaistia dalseonensis]MDQ0440423.1 LacI family transcriptional regulator [Kaistia dalseonensis]